MKYCLEAPDGKLVYCKALLSFFKLFLKVSFAKSLVRHLLTFSFTKQFTKHASVIFEYFSF